VTGADRRYRRRIVTATVAGTVVLGGLVTWSHLYIVGHGLAEKPCDVSCRTNDPMAEGLGRMADLAQRALIASAAFGLGMVVIFGFIAVARRGYRRLLIDSAAAIAAAGFSTVVMFAAFAIAHELDPLLLWAWVAATMFIPPTVMALVYCLRPPAPPTRNWA
jgi:hypothetical protein